MVKNQQQNEMTDDTQMTVGAPAARDRDDRQQGNLATLISHYP